MATFRRLDTERELLQGVFNEEKNKMFLPNPAAVFHIPKNYPFHPPSLRIHDKEYVIHLAEWYRTLYPVIKQYNIELGCICCTTLVCKWSPCNTCKQMYDEYISYRDKLRLCTQIFYISKLPFDDNVCSIITSCII